MSISDNLTKCQEFSNQETEADVELILMVQFVVPGAELLEDEKWRWWDQQSFKLRG